ncbi:uncharacterized protein LOC113217777 [Frankliniella occidentalis]|uniref:Uncharacterized protein LOC113217777 n=1 Tax=Frankliniella occidentalis TaxID=133901 RepID=A0A6J1TLH9_FRAOC|nr:uncharacterized protein LOC113217777 [Frankliniella occidentalis]
MEVLTKLAVLAAIFVVSGEALFAPKCLWSGLLGSSEESGERWLRDTTSLRTRDSRVRRFLWTDKDVCDWMCRDDYGSEVRDICRRCCPGSAAATQRPRPPTAATASEQSRAPRTTVSVGATATTAQASDGTQSTTAGTTGAASTPAAATTAASSAPTTLAAATTVPAGK